MEALTLDTDTIINEVNGKGFTIARGAVDGAFITRQRNRWMTYFSGKPKAKNFVRGGLILGEPNFCSYSRIPAWCMYRYFEFLWNENDDQEALNTHLAIHELRNKMQGLPLDSGLRFNQNSYGIYISTSLYEPDKGMLEAHKDGHGEVPILHYMMPLSFKGIDYSAGGLHVKGRDGKIADVDELVRPGDLIFFDGRCEHWVKRIERSNKQQLGRLAVFSVPTFFQKSAFSGMIKRSFQIQKYQISSSLKNIVAPRSRYPQDHHS